MSLLFSPLAKLPLAVLPLCCVFALRQPPIWIFASMMALYLCVTFINSSTSPWLRAEKSALQILLCVPEDYTNGYLLSQIYNTTFLREMATQNGNHSLSVWCVSSKLSKPKSSLSGSLIVRGYHSRRLCIFDLAQISSNPPRELSLFLVLNQRSSACYANVLTTTLRRQQNKSKKSTLTV